ncbi:MAG TPA: cation-translocating P-type ATPase [Candidatus Polarisedimenticolia bacterium]|nr:cation-translocating P-type ATPase [Candidatus Polarisedimenticolia bacterium]
MWHALPPEEVLERLASGPAGLTASEAERRLREQGGNELAAPVRHPAWALLLRQFRNVLTLLLLGAALLSLLLGHRSEAAAIAVIVLLSATLGFAQEYRAEGAMRALRRLAAPKARVVRDGSEIDIAARNLVPGDLVLLRAGDRVPADIRLTRGANLRVDEAALTGESVPVAKEPATLRAKDVPLPERRCMAYAGTVAAAGRGQGVVVATGMATEFGGIASLLTGIEPGRTPLQKDLDRLARILAWAGLAVVMLVAAFGVFQGAPLLATLVFGIALAVAIVPEALPAVLTISLAMGLKRMARRHALMRRLSIVETLGCVSVICADKTGTLTQDEMTVRRIFAAGEMLDVTGSGFEPVGDFRCGGSSVASLPEAVNEVLRAGVLASDARMYRGQDGRWCVRGDPTEGALVVAAMKAGLAPSDLEAGLPRVGEIPFTSESRRMTTLHRGPAGPEAFSKGAPEVVLHGCTAWLAGEGERALDPEGVESILKIAHAMAAEGLRVLALARKKGTRLEDAEHGMTFLGLAAMIDPPRPEAKSAVRTCRDAGIRVVMVTGDHPLTARAVGGELGLLESGRLATGAEVELLSREELEDQVEVIEVYARMLPAQKLRVVEALQRRGHVVAMTGDGINDAPALKRADVGVAMGINGTDVSREAADVTLIDDNFASIVAAVEEGRGIFDNTRKYLTYLFTSNIGEIGLMGAAAVLGFPMPLTAVQILYVNLATDGLPALALAAEPSDPCVMRRPPRDPKTGIFSRGAVSLMLLGGAWSATANLGLMAWALAGGRSLPEARTLTFVSLVLMEFFKAYCFRSPLRPVLRSPFGNLWLNLAVLWELLLLFMVVTVPGLSRSFGGFPLTHEDWAVALLMAATIVPVVEAGKWGFGERDTRLPGLPVRLT